MSQDPIEHRNRLATLVAALSDRHVGYLVRISTVLAEPATVEVNPTSDLPEGWAEHFGEVLQLHHLNSVEPFTKDKFEYAMVAVMTDLGGPAEKSIRGNPGADIAVADETWSLKTQADRSIRTHVIHISKFMELGKGRWETDEDLEALRQRMLDHMTHYDRIFSLRCLTPHSQRQIEYELVEIPKALLELSALFPCHLIQTSKQNPKPGRCSVTRSGRVLFELYFDGGTERKLQVQKIRLDECVVHARWKF